MTVGRSLHPEPQQNLGPVAGETPKLLLQSPDPPPSNPSASPGGTALLPAAQEARETPARPGTFRN